MKVISKQAFADIRAWIYRSARPLSMAMWKYLFEGGSAQEVCSVLSFYQNPDGGFGHGLELDDFNPASSPAQVSYAISLFETLQLTDRESPLIRGVVRYLENTTTFSGGEWLFTVPHASWRSCSAGERRRESIGITADMCSFVLRCAERGSELYSNAARCACSIVDVIHSRDDLDEMGISGAISLVAALEKSILRNSFDFDMLHARLSALVNASIERSSEKWSSYCVRPSRFIHSKESPFYEFNSSLVERELDYLVDTLPTGMVWDINRSWSDPVESCADSFAISTGFRKAIKAMENLLFLNAFGRLER